MRVCFCPTVETSALAGREVVVVGFNQARLPSDGCNRQSDASFGKLLRDEVECIIMGFLGA